MHLMQLAKTRSAEAEAYLASELQAESDPNRLRQIAEALQLMGSVGARDALVDSLAKFRETPELLAIVLRSLIGLFIDRSAEVVLQFVQSEWPEAVRVNAALALGHCDRAKILNQLADNARTEEGNANVRQAVIVALTSARSFGLLRRLEAELPEERPENEQYLIWSYVGALGRQITSTRDYGQQWSTIERIILRELERFEVPPLPLIREAATLKSSKPIAARLEAVLRNTDAEDETRAAVLTALAAIGVLPHINELMTAFVKVAFLEDSSSLARSYARIIADTHPELLLSIDNLFATTALWEFSLERNRFVFQDRLQSADIPFIMDYRPEAQVEPTVVSHETIASKPIDLKGTLDNLSAVMSWIQDNLDPKEPDGPVQLPDQAKLLQAWVSSHRLNDSPKSAYRTAAVFCSLMNMSFPIVKSEWPKDSFEAIFNLGIELLTQWPRLLVLIGVGSAKHDSIRRAYARACKQLEVSESNPLAKPATVVQIRDLTASHFKRPGHNN